MSKSVRIPYQKDGKECAVIVKKPTHSQLTEANLYAASVFNRARKTGVCLRSQIDDWLEEQGIWTADDRKKIKELEKGLVEKINKLEKGKNDDGTQMKLSEARKLCMEIRIDRWKLNLVIIKKREYDQYTVEGQTENARFDCLASLCILDEEGNKLFKDVDDYFEQGDEEHITKAATTLANLMFGDNDWEKKLEENQFLLEHKLCDENLRLVNSKGEFVDSDGNVLTKEEVEKQEIEEKAEYINDLW